MKHVSQKSAYTNQKQNPSSKITKNDIKIKHKSSTYFQIGLIISLLCVYSILELQFASKTFANPTILENDYTLEEVHFDTFKVYEEKTVKQKETTNKNQKVLLNKEPKVVKNTTPEAEVTKQIITAQQNTSSKKVAIANIENVTEPDEPVTIPYNVVEIMPIFPGCEKETSNIGRKECLSTKLAKYIQKKFNTEIATDLGLKGEQKINVMFTISKTGKIINVKARTPYKALEEEAIRVITNLPEMIPGVQKNKKVSVTYGFPIRFKILH